MKGLKKHTLDFEIIPTGNSKTLVFIDSSDYYTEPEKPLLEITLPGYKKFFLVNIVARKVNTFNSNTIGLTEIFNNNDLVDLPDGVYNFKFKVCPYEASFISKKVFRTTLIDLKIANIYEQLDATDCDVKNNSLLIPQITEVVALIEGAKAIVNKNEKKAVLFYQLADKLIDRISCKLDKSYK